MSSAPIALAFSAGLVAAFNPCGFAMLPALLSYVLHEVASPTEHPGAGRLAKGLLFGLMMTVGFVSVFLLFGALLTLGSRAIMSYMPYVSLLVGAALVLLGAYLLTGHQLHLRWVPGVRVHKGSGVVSFFALGIGYALASLSCTIPIFLVAIGASVAAGGALAGLLAFVSYALGMGVVVTGVAMAVAIAGTIAVGRLRGVLPYVQRASAAIVLLAGLYLIYYQLSLLALR